MKSLLPIFHFFGRGIVTIEFRTHLCASRPPNSLQPTSGKSFDLTGCLVFKMSIGEAADPADAHLFAESLEHGYVFLGFDEIDWSDDRFANRDAMIEA